MASKLELLPLAKELNEVNKVLIEREQLLAQLSLLQNVSQLIQSECSNSNLFQIQHRIMPSADAEAVLITIRNVQQAFVYRPECWSWSFSYSNDYVCVWSLSRPFRVDDVEQYTLNLIPIMDRNDEKNEVVVNLHFSMQWHETSFTKIFPVHAIPIDILHILSLARRPLPKELGVLANAVPEQASPTNLTKFVIHADAALCSVFIEMVILHNIDILRGFDIPSSSKSFQTTKEFAGYIYNDKIVITLEVNDQIEIRCSNPNLLLLVKHAVYTRLLSLCKKNMVTLTCVDDLIVQAVESLYQQKLNVETTMASPSDDEHKRSQLKEIYFDVRSVTENILRFGLVVPIEQIIL